MTQSFQFKLCDFLKIPEHRRQKTSRKSPKSLESLAKLAVNCLPLPEAFSWTVYDVSRWIANMGFPE